MYVADSNNYTYNTTTTMFSTLFLWLFFAVIIANLSFSYATTTGQWANQTAHKTRCIPMEMEALLEFKKHLVDRSNRLATWTASAADDDCCSWKGVSCRHLGNSTTQYVTGLHLRSLSQDEFYRGYYSSSTDPYMKTLFGGPLLLNRRWRFAYSQFLDRMWDKIWWKLHRLGMF